MTEQQAEQVQTQIYRRMTPYQKLEQASQLYELAWALKRAGVKLQHPHWTHEQVEKKVREIFLYAST